VREAVFSILSSLGVIEGASVLDLFAGSGALGIEAISRGAARAGFVESTAPGVEAIARNLPVLGDRRHDASVVRDDAVSYVRGCGYFDLVFADPPYAFERWDDLLRCLATRTGLLVIETSERPRSATQLGVAECLEATWETVKAKRYGGTVVLVVRPMVAVGPAEEGNF
jgi:16S rRNA (guanine966-N2)-methyltransferase